LSTRPGHSPRRPSSTEKIRARAARHSNALTLDIGTSPLAQGTSTLAALVGIARWDAPAPPVREFTPPRLAAAG
jgi:hypothetical protein